MAERRITAGGAALLKEIRAQGLSVPEWCERHRVDRLQAQRLINGYLWQRVSVDLAHQIDRATEGRVGMAMFRSRTARARKAAA